MYRDARQIVRGAPEWPAALDAAFAASGAEAMPLVPSIWVRGRLPEAGERQVAVVGARKATAGGLVTARAVAAGLAGAEIGVVSGGAIGIDGAAHRGALDAGGRTVVVLGSGIDVPYPPQHAPLFDEVVAGGGAILSVFERDAQPVQWHFPRRNRHVAALCEAVVLVEASTASGSLHTARAAQALGRRVIAVRGSAGCDLLVARGAAEPAQDADEVLALLLAGAPAPRAEGEPAQAALPLGRQETRASRPARPATPPLPADPRARLLYEALDRTPRDLGEVAHRAGLPASEAMALAIDLELGGHAARAAGGRYLRLG